MKTLTRKCKYALRALYVLTRQFERGPVSVSVIAAREAMPKKFLEAILVELRNAGIVESHSGKHGGYRLAEPPEVITIGAVIRAIDGPLAPLPCAGEQFYQPCPDCPDPGRCETRKLMRAVRDAIAEVLDGTTLAQACEPPVESISYDI